jgi:hypothetical protein
MLPGCSKFKKQKKKDFKEKNFLKERNYLF